MRKIQQLKSHLSNRLNELNINLFKTLMQYIQKDRKYIIFTSIKNNILCVTSININRLSASSIQASFLFV